MKRKIVWLPVIALTLALLPCGLSARPGPRTGKEVGPGDGHHHHRVWMELNLTAEQKEKLKALREEMQPIRKKHLESVKAVRDKIKTELLKTDPSQNILYGYAGELGELHKQMTKDRTDHLLKVKAILTSEQFSKLVEKEGKIGCEKGFGHRGGKHPRKEDGCPHNDDMPDSEE